MTVASVERVATPRLICECLRPGHAAELTILLSDPRVSQRLWPGREPPTEAELLESLAAKVEHWGQHGFGLWLVRDRGSGEMVGRGGLQHTHVGGRDEVEAGWAITPARWGQGLATELALASLEVGFGELGLSEIVAFTLPANAASVRVMEKAGFVYERDITRARLPHVLYRRRTPARPMRAEKTENASAFSALIHLSGAQPRNARRTHW